MNQLNELAEKRLQAESLISKYTAAGAVAVLLVSIVPVAASFVLSAIELAMIYQLGLFYKSRWTVAEARAVGATVGLAAIAGKCLAMEAAILLGPLSCLAKPIIAAGIIKGLGSNILKHFEELPPDGNSEKAIGQSK